MILVRQDAVVLKASRRAIRTPPGSGYEACIHKDNLCTLNNYVIESDLISTRQKGIFERRSETAQPPAGADSRRDGAF